MVFCCERSTGCAVKSEAEAVLRRRGKWAQKNVPHLGWVCVSEYDAKENSGELIVCEMCEAMEVRFVHVMANERFSGQLECGCVCAAHMSGEKKQAEDRDRRMRARASRRANFHKRKGWKVSRAGLAHIQVDGFHFVVSEDKGGGFRIGAKDARDERYTWGRRRYSTVQEAKTGCFDALEYMEQKQLAHVRAQRDALLQSAVMV
jgi:hypothetical protein